ncbi:MAG: hypothetical protein MUF21_14430 [Gemmatimonadaceae bacterium]|jgi:hypothetical protein|nr:hypothetical protein [Gemmatimonadaceae bacterium]
MFLRRPLRRVTAALAALWVTAQAALAPMQACQMHDGTAAESAVAHAHHASTAREPAVASHEHHAVAPDAPAVATNARHATVPDGVRAHCAGDEARTAAAPASPHEEHAPPCTCSGNCCPGALVALPALAPARVVAIVAAGPAPAPDHRRTADAPHATVRHRQPPATAPPVLIAA